MRYVIEEDTFINGWASTWTDELGYPLSYGAENEAKDALTQYTQDAIEAALNEDIAADIAEAYRIRGIE